MKMNIQKIGREIIGIEANAIARLRPRIGKNFERAVLMMADCTTPAGMLGQPWGTSGACVLMGVNNGQFQADIRIACADPSALQILATAASMAAISSPYSRVTGNCGNSPVMLAGGRKKMPACAAPSMAVSL